MPTPAIALKIKKIRRRFGITAPNVVIRTHFPRYWYVVAAMFFLALLFSLIWLLVQRNAVGAISGELESLRMKVRELDDERVMLRSTAGTEQNLALLERSTQQQLLLRVRALEAENAALMEDMLLFERLIPAPGDEAIVRVESFRLQEESDNRFRYRLLLAYQPAKTAPGFKGAVQLHVFYSLREKQHRLVLPVGRSPGSGIPVEMQNFWRKEGAFDLPSGASIVQAEVRVFQGDTLKAKQLAKL